ncbi:hypothetical protein N7520_006500 [Penicillium odoratum]|uniref:uncharacterized protein n=1 Tax=Penicillium odoratum TaxID=1167516 RepID=UPI0025496BA8|nr:uncharacterized protein N7520_006500 [Penicillium odoratum]KAJ5759344.1 hypothetical protein N7520_006500 [Penicillium odoratum]
MSLQIAPQRTCLPLTKFSHTTTTINHGGPLAWTHVNSDVDLVCILEQISGERSVPPRLLLRVARNDGILIRRFQIKFLRNTDYFTALALLSDINCPLTEGSTSSLQPQRLPSASSWASFQVPTPGSKEPSTVATSDNEATIPFFPMSGHIHSGMTCAYLIQSGINNLIPMSVAPNPPSSASSIVYNLAGQAVPIAQNPFELTTTRQNKGLPSSHPKHETPQGPKMRPATVPAYYGDQLDQMLPPKRDLPFLKPSQKRPRREGIETPTDSQLASTSQPPINTTVNQSLFPLTDHDRISVPHCSQVSDSQSQSQSQIPAQPLLDTLPMGRPLSQPQASDHGAYPVLDPISKQPPSAPGHDSVAFIQVDPGDAGKAAQPTAISKDQLSAYLGAPTPARTAFLENWICELIEDDGFMALCQDVEVTWRRFAFGVEK